MQANWVERYLTQVRYFSHVNARLKVSHSGEMSHLGAQINDLESFKQMIKISQDRSIFLLHLDYILDILTKIYQTLKNIF